MSGSSTSKRELPPCPRRRRAPRRRGSRRSVAAVLSAALIASACEPLAQARETALPGRAAEDAAKPAARSRGTPAPAAPAGSRSRAGLDSLLTRLERLDAALDASAFDLDALAERLPTDPAAAFAFVRDSVAYEAYPGVLRGARGALMARAGNAWDRSLLLAHLLRAKDHEVRFATAELPTAEADRLFEQLFVPIEHGAPGAGDSALARAAGLEPQHRAQLVDSLVAAAGEAAEIGALVRSSVERLRPLLEAGRPPASGSAPQRLAAAIRDHAWVQVRAGEDWLDLDSSFRDARPGVAVVPSTRAGPSVAPERFWRFALELELVQRRGDVRTPRAIGEWNGSVSDLLFSSMTLTIAPTNYVQGELYTPQDLDVATRFIPVLQVDGGIHTGSPFDLEGHVGTKLGERLGVSGATIDALVDFTADLEEGVRGLGAGIGGMLGGGGIGGMGERDVTPPAEQARPFVEAIRARYVLVSPAGEREAHERTLYTAPPAAASTADLRESKIRLLGSVQMQLFGGRIPAPYVLHRFARLLLGNERLLKLAAGEGPQPASLEEVEELLRAAQRDAIHLLAYASMSALSSMDPIDRERLRRVYVDEPNLVTYTAQGVAQADRRLRVEEGFDIVRDEIAYVARDETAQAGAWDFRLRRGIYVTGLELALQPGAREAANALRVLDEAERSAVPLRVVRPQEPVAAEELQLAPEDRALVEAALARGETVIVPERSVELDGRPRTGWLRVDAEGNALGILQGGGGQTTVEHVLTAFLAGAIVAEIMSLWQCYCRDASAGVCVAYVTCQGFVGGILGVISLLTIGDEVLLLEGFFGGVQISGFWTFQTLGAPMGWLGFNLIGGAISGEACGGLAGLPEPPAYTTESPMFCFWPIS
ncbi:MAG: hypothetical protein ABR599_11005 [Gemmatimonadota bacterium]